ncbi:hypothetical protein RRG08_039482 [Elysia crispata]|uniref:Uncharacterized protein n=1 Tax=Elysia crispata TaxID=231223 RepID=A0AAE1D0P6_9GAST|nr:hypothetical protein RRG08_039482 [Elysia crispata]
MQLYHHPGTWSLTELLLAQPPGGLVSSAIKTWVTCSDRWLSVAGLSLVRLQPHAASLSVCQAKTRFLAEASRDERRVTGKKERKRKKELEKERNEKKKEIE